MAKNTTSNDQFNYSFRAACKTCGNYVGPTRDFKSEANQDGQDHKKIPGNEDHVVTPIKTQRT